MPYHYLVYEYAYINVHVLIMPLFLLLLSVGYEHILHLKIMAACFHGIFYHLPKAELGHGLIRIIYSLRLHAL